MICEIETQLTLHDSPFSNAWVNLNWNPPLSTWKRKHQAIPRRVFESSRRNCMNPRLLLLYDSCYHYARHNLNLSKDEMCYPHPTLHIQLLTFIKSYSLLIRVK